MRHSAAAYWKEGMYPGHDMLEGCYGRLKDPKVTVLWKILMWMKTNKLTVGTMFDIVVEQIESGNRNCA